MFLLRTICDLVHVVKTRYSEYFEVTPETGILAEEPKIGEYDTEELPAVLVFEDDARTAIETKAVV